MFFVKDKNFYRKILTIAVPITLQSLITFATNMMDTIMVGSLGEIA
ncbi:MATE efflux family protein, partial [Candidatus Arthromitus sp. SFB-5]